MKSVFATRRVTLLLVLFMALSGSVQSSLFRRTAGASLSKKSILKGSSSRLVKHKRHVNDLSNVASGSSKAVDMREQAISKARGGGRQSEPERVPPDYQAMRANLSPLGKVIAGSCEVGVTTGMSYVSSGMLGYFGMGVWQLKSIGELGMKGIHAKAVTSGKSWGELGAYFSGFGCAAKVIRGGKEDKWNQVLASFAAGVCLSKGTPPMVKLKSGATYAAFSYAIDSFAGGGGGERDEMQFQERAL
ncbi:hypothetical protein TrVE_jg6343 [Triparma verrucosa]|uniref:Mitochondrial import inner membrane translocase subunit TIM22 n=1 Tax=Triparma verrucosa TaxID=1606542 RepID=A0A9W7EZ95_9STRA|nr:hypothetical protein TrVE_jg6343 [Triparma verrucosa]